MFGLDKATEEFVNALLEDFRKHGASAIERLREQNPQAWLALIAAFAFEELREGLNCDT